MSVVIKNNSTNTEYDVVTQKVHTVDVSQYGLGVVLDTTQGTNGVFATYADWALALQTASTWVEITANENSTGERGWMWSDAIQATTWIPYPGTGPLLTDPPYMVGTNKETVLIPTGDPVYNNLGRTELEGLHPIQLDFSISGYDAGDTIKVVAPYSMSFLFAYYGGGRSYPILGSRSILYISYTESLIVECYDSNVITSNYAWRLLEPASLVKAYGGSPPRRDGWGNIARLGKSGFLNRYTLSEDEYDEVILQTPVSVYPLATYPGIDYREVALESDLNGITWGVTTIVRVLETENVYLRGYLGEFNRIYDGSWNGGITQFQDSVYCITDSSPKDIVLPGWCWVIPMCEVGFQDYIYVSRFNNGSFFVVPCVNQGDSILPLYAGAVAHRFNNASGVRVPLFVGGGMSGYATIMTPLFQGRTDEGIAGGGWYTNGISRQRVGKLLSMEEYKKNIIYTYDPTIYGIGSPTYTTVATEGDIISPAANSWWRCEDSLDYLRYYCTPIQYDLIPMSSYGKPIYVIGTNKERTLLIPADNPTVPFLILPNRGSINPEYFDDYIPGEVVTINNAYDRMWIGNVNSYPRRELTATGYPGFLVPFGIFQYYKDYNGFSANNPLTFYDSSYRDCINTANLMPNEKGALIGHVLNLEEYNWTHRNALPEVTIISETTVTLQPNTRYIFYNPSNVDVTFGTSVVGDKFFICPRNTGAITYVGASNYVLVTNSTTNTTEFLESNLITSGELNSGVGYDVELFDTGGQLFVTQWLGEPSRIVNNFAHYHSRFSTLETIPAPTTGDSGKALVVNGAETGYELLTGATGTFTTVDGKTVTVNKGLITSIV